MMKTMNNYMVRPLVSALAWKDKTCWCVWTAFCMKSWYTFNLIIT